MRNPSLAKAAPVAPPALASRTPQNQGLVTDNTEGRAGLRPPKRFRNNDGLAIGIEPWKLLPGCISFANIGIANVGQCQILAGSSDRA